MAATKAYAMPILVNTVGAGVAYIGLRKAFPRSFATHPGRWWLILDLDLNQWPARGAHRTARPRRGGRRTDRLLVTRMHLHFPGFAHLVREGTGYRLIPEAGNFFATQFYADVEGHPDDPNLKLALEERAYFSKELTSSESIRRTRSARS